MVAMLIDGEPRTAATGTKLEVLDPATEEALEAVPAAGVDDVDWAVESAAAALANWSATDPEQRADVLRKAMDLVEANAESIADTLTHEQGKPTLEARGEITHFVHGVRFYADLATKIRGGYQPLPSTLGRSYGLVIKRPVGVVAAIVPSNYPLTLMGTKIGPALATGNSVVVKPAATTPLATLRVANLFLDAGLPPGVLNVVTGRGAEIGDRLVSHELVRRVAFTGETETGRHVMSLAGPALKRVTMELGGSDAMIVCPDADLAKAVKGAVIGRFWNAGQSCLAAKRLFVFAEVYDEFVDMLRAEVGRYECGEGWTKPEKPKIRFGPVHTAGARARLTDQLADATSRGGSVLVGGGPPVGRDRGYYFRPTVVADAPADSRLMTEEVFGPILPVVAVADIDEAVNRANDTRFGLGSSIWTRDAGFIDRAARDIEAGMTWVNQIHYGYDEMPFGGVKDSGFGKEHGEEALDYYVDIKSVVVGGLG